MLVSLPEVVLSHFNTKTSIAHDLTQKEVEDGVPIS
jgi:hypothetical protein